MKIIIILIAISIFTILNILLKIFGYLNIMKKYEKIANAEIIGYYFYYNFTSLTWYPVIKFYDDKNNEIITISHIIFNFPVFKIGEKIKVKYYLKDNYNIEEKSICIND